jgi:signal transduction histidine kinase
MLIIAFLAIYGAVHGRGPLTGPDALYNVTSLQLFLLFTVTPFMVLATLVAERNRTEEVVSTLNRRLIVAQEQERRRIARELHDDIGQRLALLICELENVDDSPVGVRVSELSRQASEIAAAIRSLSHELHSSRLEYLGLTAAMRGFCEEFGGQEKVEIDFKAHDVPTDLPKTISLSFFRVLQEGLRNAAKHSGVRHFEVRLWGTSHEMHLTLTDFGVGFDREAAIKSGGLGLISMEERLKLVNGTFSIRSQPKRGTVIEACVPVPPEAFP